MNSPTLFLLVNRISPEGKEYNLLHCNWGWNGELNGYYRCRVFNTNNGPVFDEVPTRSNQAHITDTIFSTH